MKRLGKHQKGGTKPACTTECEEGPHPGARERFRRLYGILRSRICMLDYPPGMRLSEEALAAEFGLSRTPLRRVLGRLESEGLLTSVHGVGTIVSDVDVKRLEQVYRLRLELDALIGHLAPVPPDEATVALFRELAARSLALAGTPEPRAFARLNMEFFHALMRLTASEPLQETSERLFYQTARIWLKSIFTFDLSEEARIFSREVADTLAAVEIGDLKAASLVRCSHMSMCFTRLRRQDANGGHDRTAPRKRLSSGMGMSGASPKAKMS